MNCYCCSRPARHVIHLGKWQPVCIFHLDEAEEEETDGVLVRTLENHMEVLKREQHKVIA